jgi:hypothetical protein
VHRTVNNTCPVGHSDSLHREAHNGCSRDVALDCPVCTRQSGNGRIQRLTATDPNDRLMWLGHRRMNSACPVCTGLSDAPVDRKLLLLSNGYNWGGFYQYSTTDHFKVWEPKKHTKSYCRQFQVLIHPSA